MRLSRTFFVIILALLSCSNHPANITMQREAIIYVGTFKREPSKGIYAWRMNLSSGKMDALGLVADVMRPVFVALHPKRKFLYAVSRPTAVDRTDTGFVYAYAVDATSAKLTFLNRLSTRGIDPVYVTTDRTGQNVLAANFGSNDGNGCVSVFPIKKDGSLEDASDFIQYTGAGAHPQRQKGPHSHAINVSPDNRFAFVADLGLDRIFVYHFDAEQGKLKAASPSYVTLKPGAGPRQFVFHPNGKFLYVVNEIQSTITTFSYAAGALKEVQTLSTLPQGFNGTNSTSSLQVHPNGKFLYVTNRGADDVAVYSVDSGTGTLTLTDSVPTKGKTPSSLVIDPSGGWLIVTNQASDAIVSFKIDPLTGKLIATTEILDVAAPACARFLVLN